ncbi:hypothetical protein PHET_03238 [Paragonimus heterotremus]|uniref:Conserved oligomeric Golgi complex subunit 1 n=1 Tax=Paragonimus heterotremus TaxID=100268 RepID=A0A8J4T0T4_9TREM|nr:hypothetical protein PHET_03238 [Paragonimus heterotremus]
MDAHFSELFKKHTIPELQDLLRIRRGEVEKKKDELRYLVGERHRDVIEASDTIQAMKNLSETIASSVESLARRCTFWNKPVEACVDPQRSTFDNRLIKLSVAAHLKCLLDIPEIIWNLMDAGDHLTAVILCYVGRHVSTRLQLSSETCSADLDVLVFVKRLWNSLVQTESAVLSACRRRLSALPPTVRELNNSLAALVLLTNSTMKAALEEYLAGRKIALVQLLGDANPRSATPDGKQLTTLNCSLRKKVALITKFLLTTLNSVEAIFHNDHEVDPEARSIPCEGALSRELHKLKDWVMHDMTWFADGRLYKHLPDDVINYRLPQGTNIQSDDADHVLETPCGILVQDLPVEVLHDLVGTWWTDIIASCRLALSNALTHASSLKRLVATRASVLRLLSKWHPNDGSVNHALLRRPVDLWTELFSEQFLTQISRVVNGSIDRCWEEWTIAVTQLMDSSVGDQSDSSGNADKSNNDLNEAVKVDDLAAFVWSDSTPDVFVNDVWTPLSSSAYVPCENKPTHSGNNSIESGSARLGSSNLARILKPDNVGVIVFCALTGRPVPSILTNRSSCSFSTESAANPPIHLLVFLQRLSVNRANTTVVSAQSDPNTKSTATGHFTRPTHLPQKLSLVSPALQNVCSLLDDKLASVILDTSTSAGRDSVAIWELLRSAMERLISSCVRWILSVAYGFKSENRVNLEEYIPPIIEPSRGLLLGRACMALMNLCPSIGAALVAATGVLLSSETSTNVVNERKDGSENTKPEFSWSDVSTLRSAWISVCQPLRQILNRLTVDCLTRALIQGTLMDEFHHRLLSICPLFKSDPKCTSTNDASNGELQRPLNVPQLLVEFGQLDSFSHYVIPFDEIQLHSDAVEELANKDAVAIARVPCSISLPLHQFLLRAVRAVGQLVVHMVPSQNLNRELSARVCSALLRQYDAVADRLISPPTVSVESDKQNGTAPISDIYIKWSNSSNLPDCHLLALQLIFDIHYLMRLLIGSSVGPTLQTPVMKDDCSIDQLVLSVQIKAKELSTRLEGFVDPFDWEVCSMHLFSSVARAVVASAHLYAPFASCSVVAPSIIETPKAGPERSQTDSTTTASLIPLVFMGSGPNANEKRALPSFHSLTISLPSVMDKQRAKLNAVLGFRQSQQVQNSLINSSKARSVTSQITPSEVSLKTTAVTNGNSFMQLGSRWFSK